MHQSVLGLQGGNLNTARTTAAGAGASNASGLTFGGSPIPGVAGKTELYDGTSWTEVNDLNKGGTGLGGTGTSTSAIAFGREDPFPPTGVNPDNLTELWNGTNWTEVNNLNAVRARMGSAGADNTSALCISGLSPPDGTANVEQWNGTNWTEVADFSYS